MRAQSIIKPDAILFSVSDLQRSLHFYRDGLGFKPDAQSAFPTSSATVASLIGAPGATVRAVTLDVPGTSLRLVLLKFSGVDQRTLNPDGVKDPGGVKIVVTFREVDTVWRRIRGELSRVYSTAGTEMHPMGPQDPEYAAIAADPDGYTIEIQTNEAVLKQTTAPASSNLIGIHPGFAVRDIDGEIAFYTQGMGFQPRNHQLTPRPFPPAVLNMEGTPGIELLNFGSMPPGGGFAGGGFAWSVYEAKGTDRKDLNPRLQDIGGGGVSYIVSGLPSLVRSLIGRGARVVTQGGTPVDTGQGQKAIILSDPSGVVFELIEKAQ